ncbi:hypothetical protein ANN_06152 [Periplaneta americana]|uniref:Uncharacterized protein n=1 Tax=Periplaneta americana TaxID=6978 RepID=A0ABQ8TF83_PERAM|nr:hypothetical protein ANN_06152 [Periplaneta americana]
MNPIEHVWDMLGRRVKNRRPRPESLQELRRALGEEWELIPQEDIANQIESMPRHPLLGSSDHEFRLCTCAAVPSSEVTISGRRIIRMVGSFARSCVVHVWVNAMYPQTHVRTATLTLETVPLVSGTLEQEPKPGKQHARKVRLEAFGSMWIWRRMERMKWTDRMTNEVMLERVGEERMMLKLIWKRRRNWLGH